MATQDAIVEFPLEVGLDQKADRWKRVGLSTARNCVFRSTGALEKRYGMAALSAASAVVGGGTVQTPTWIGTRGDELVRIGPGTLHAYAPVGAAEWVSRGSSTVPAWNAPRTAVSGGDGAVWATDTAIWILGTTRLSCTAYVVSQADSTGALEFVTYVDVMHLDTGARYMSRQKVASIVGAPNKVRVIAGVGRFHIIYNTAGTVTCKSVQYTTPNTLSAAGLSVTVPSPYTAWDAHCYTTNVFIAYETTGSATPIRLAVCPSNVDGLATTTATYTSPALLTGLACMGVYSINNTQVLIASTYVSGANIVARLDNFTNGTGHTYGAAIFSYAHGGSAPVTCDVAADSSTSCTIFISLVAPSLAGSSTVDALLWGQVNQATGATAFTPMRAVHHVRAVTKPMFYATAANQWIIGVIGVHGSSTGFYALQADWPKASPTQYNPTLLASWAPGQSSHDTAYARTAVPVGGGTTVAPVAGQTGGGGSIGTTTNAPSTVFPCVVKPPTLTAGSGGTAEYTYMTAATPMAVDIGDALLVTGGQPSVYDGERVFEAGFAWAPDSSLLGVTLSNGAGALTPSGVYFYTFAYEYTDALGRRHLGPVSEATKVTLGAAEDTVVLAIPTLTVTNREPWASTTLAPSRQVTIGIYRTTAGGSVFRRVGGVQNRAYGASTVSFEDRMSDATSELQEALYTETGSVPNLMPPYAAHAAIHQGAAVLSNTDEGTLWLSKALIAGDGIGFSASLTEPAPEGGCIATASLEERLILFGSSRLWVMEGTMPNDLGASSLQPERDLSSAVGLLDARSLGKGPDGLYFQGQDYNLWLLGRGLQVEPIGMPATGAVATPTQRTICGAVNVAAQNQMRFYVLSGDGNGSDVLVLDTFHSRAGRPIWTTFGFVDPISSAAGMQARAACIYQGKATVATAHANSPIFWEDATQYLDTGGGGTAWVTMEVLTSEMRVGALQGFQRCKRVGLLARKISNHGVTVILTTDDTTTQTDSWTYTEINALTYERLRVHVVAQKGQSIRVYLADTDPGAGNRGTGQGMILSGIAALIGAKGGLRRTSAAAQR